MMPGTEEQIENILKENEELKRALRLEKEELKKRTGELNKINLQLEKDLKANERNERITKALYEISEATAKSENLDELYKNIHNIISELMPAKNFYIALYNLKTDLVEFPYYVDEYDDPPPPVKLDKGYTSYVIKTGKSIILDKTKIEEYARTGELEIIGQPTQVWVGVALKIRKKTIGAMCLQDYENPNAYGNEEKKLLNFVSEQVAHSIETKRNELQIKTYLDDLTKSEAQLRELIITKDKFFSIIAHDLRSPFQALLGASEMLHTEIEEMSLDEMKIFTRNLNSSIRNVNNLIENLLEWSRVQTGKITISLEQINLASSINRAIDLLRTNANKKNVVLINKVPNKLNVFCDEIILDTILRNLISNAIKFSFENSEVTIDAESTDCMISLTIKDTGVGIHKEDIEKLFRIDVSHSTLGTAKEKGTGLGLPLCKDLIEMCGGNISVTSQPSAGSTFTVSILHLKA